MKKFGTLLALGAIAGLLAVGCSKSSETASSTGEASPAATTSEAAASASAAATATGGAMTAMKTVAQAAGAKIVAAGDAAHGKVIFSQNCASCHGATGVEGPVGPSLKNEKAKKNTAAAIAWIKNPQPPMPKLFPGTLTEKDVADVAAYVESL